MLLEQAHGRGIVSEKKFHDVHIKVSALDSLKAISDDMLIIILQENGICAGNFGALVLFYV